MDKQKLLEMQIHETFSLETHSILRVFGGWIYTDRRGQNPTAVFVPEVLNVEMKN